MSGNVAESDFSTWMLLQGNMPSSCQAQGENVLQKNKNIAKTIKDSQLSASNFLLAAFRPLRWSPETLCSSPEPAGPGRWKKVRCSHCLTVLFNHWRASNSHLCISVSSDHVAQIMELLGKIPPDVAFSGRYSAEYFDRRGGWN